MKDKKSFQFKNIMGVCGIDCSRCQIYLAPKKPKLALKLAKAFDKMWDNVKPEDFHCSTCRGELSECWTKECWIRSCCVDDKNLDFCYQCQDFPCKGLEEWANKNKRYMRALITLKNMKDNKKKTVSII
jgi:hypothetical protein